MDRCILVLWDDEDMDGRLFEPLPQAKVEATKEKLATWRKAFWAEWVQNLINTGDASAELVSGQKLHRPWRR